MVIGSFATCKLQNSGCNLNISTSQLLGTICRLLFLLWLIIVVMGPSSTHAAETINLSVAVGFDSYYKNGHWTPVQVTVENNGPNITGELQFLDSNTPFNVPSLLYRYPLDLPTQSRKQLDLVIPLRGQSRVAIILVDDQNKPIAEKTVKVRSIEHPSVLIGVVATDLSLLNDLPRIRSDSEKQRRVAHLTPFNLPSLPQALDGLDLLVFNNVDTSQLTTAQQTALATWVTQGGQLFVGGGPNANQTIAGLTTILPFTTVQIKTLPHPLSALQTFANVAALPDRGPYVAAIPDIIIGDVIVDEDGVPLLIEQSFGLGTLYYSVLDLGLAPLDTLRKRSGFMDSIWGFPSANPSSFVATLDQDDIRTGLSILSQQTLPDPQLVCLYLLIYVVLIGPLNFIILRLIKRGEWAWITIPVMIIGCTAVIYMSGFQLRGRQPILTQISIVEGSTATNQALVTNFSGIYSPSRADYQLQAEVNQLVTGLPDSVGLTNQLAIVQQGNTQINNLRGDIGGQPAVMLAGTTSSPDIVANLTYDGSDLTGEIINNSPHTLEDASLVIMLLREDLYEYDERFQPKVAKLDNLKPGQKTINLPASYRGYYETFYRHASESDDITLITRDMTLRAIFLESRYNYDDQEAMIDEPTAFLVGWVPENPLPTQLTSHSHDQAQDTLMIIQVPLTINE